ILIKNPVTFLIKNRIRSINQNIIIMRVINVICIEKDCIPNIYSFGIFEEQLSSEVTEKAEELFEKKITEMYFDATEELIERAKDNGSFEFNNQSVSLVWSEI
ncbi:MAG: hypothetical protein PF487_01090, partial [Bacteroidales bacterium]|nr:hypothetical protein [Bacteroidales bacterium]